MLKKLVIIFCCVFLLQLSINAQLQDSVLVDDSTIVNNIADSVITDTVPAKPDSLPLKPVHRIQPEQYGLDNILKENVYLNSGSAVFHIQSIRTHISKDLVFYSLALILLFLGILKVTYARYFNNLIRVFFNTSLRQGQLTDQLLQAKLPSLFFNIFFVITGGWYLYLLLNHFNRITFKDWNVLAFCIAGLFVIYASKFATLKFAGWLTGYREEAETYIFIVFLINKIIALCLVPVIIIIPFSNHELVDITIIISYVVIVLMFLMRFFRSYGLLQTRLKVSGFHFLLYIIGIELLPLLLIYKFALIILTKNL